MKIVEIIVSSGRVIPHLYQSYANLRPAVSLRASLKDGDDVEAIALTLRAECESMLDDHVGLIYDRLKAEYEAARLNADDLKDEEIDEDEDTED